MEAQVSRARRILIVDDDPSDIMFLKRGFSAATSPVDVSETTDPTQVASISESLQPDMVVVDLKMPMMSGEAVIAAMRAKPENDTRALVILSSSRAPKDIKRSYEYRANAYYVKPTTLGGYHDLARRLLEHWFETAELNIR